MGSCPEWNFCSQRNKLCCGKIDYLVNTVFINSNCSSRHRRLPPVSDHMHLYAKILRCKFSDAISLRSRRHERAKFGTIRKSLEKKLLFFFTFSLNRENDYSIIMFVVLFHMYFRFRNPVSPDDFPVMVYIRERLYFRVHVDTEDKRLSILALNCFATPSQDRSSRPRYVVIRDG